LVGKLIWAYFIGMYTYFFGVLFLQYYCIKSSFIGFYFLVFFELYNFLGTLLSKRESKPDVLFMQKKRKYIFKPKWFNVAFDRFTDICFFILGSFLFVFCILKFDDKIVIIVLSILALYLALATRYWYVTKRYQLYARFPFQFRLSQWDFTINSPYKLKVEKFLYRKSKGNHLLIFGSLGVEKISLGVGILNELSIKNNSC
jgi:hypothetical protein